MSLFAVQYTYTDDAAGLDEHRPAHRQFLRGLAEEDLLLLCGPYADEGFPGALLVLRANSAETVLTRLTEDPFQKVGLVADVQIREWNAILGSRQQALADA